jgi:hypothetical protein
LRLVRSSVNQSLLLSLEDISAGLMAMPTCWGWVLDSDGNILNLQKPQMGFPIVQDECAVQGCLPRLGKNGSTHPPSSFFEENRGENGGYSNGLGGSSVGLRYQPNTLDLHTENGLKDLSNYPSHFLFSWKPSAEMPATTMPPKAKSASLMMTETNLISRGLKTGDALCINMPDSQQMQQTIPVFSQKHLAQIGGHASLLSAGVIGPFDNYDSTPDLSPLPVRLADNTEREFPRF